MYCTVNQNVSLYIGIGFDDIFCFEFFKINIAMISLR